MSLPTACDTSENVGLDVVAMGNGATMDFGGLSNELHFAALKIVSSDDCIKAYPQLFMNSSFKYKFRESMICANNRLSRKSVCNGDSGSGLITKSNSTLIGVANMAHPKGCEQGFPQGFQNIYSYLGWIKSITGMDLPTC